MSCFWNACTLEMGRHKRTTSLCFVHHRWRASACLRWKILLGHDGNYCYLWDDMLDADDALWPRFTYYDTTVVCMDFNFPLFCHRMWTRICSVQLAQNRYILNRLSCRSIHWNTSLHHVLQRICSRSLFGNSTSWQPLPPWRSKSSRDPINGD